MIRAEVASRRQQKKKQSYVEPQTQSPGKPLSSQEDPWFEIKEIVAENRDSYRIVWAGENPATGQPWKCEWKPKIEVTEDAVKEWEWKKQVREETRKHICQSNTGVKRKRSRKDSLPSPPTQSSEYVPSQELPIAKRFKSKTLFPEEIEDTFATSQLSEFSLVLGEVPQEILVTIERPQGFDKDQYTVYTNSDIKDVGSGLREQSPTPDQTQGILAESAEKRISPKQIPAQPVAQVRNFEKEPSIQDSVWSKHQIIGTFKKELSSQGSSGKVILIYERTAVIPDSRGVSPSSLSCSGPSLELSSSQEQGIPDTQVETETQETIHTLEELHHRNVTPFVSQEPLASQETSLSGLREQNHRETAVSSRDIHKPQEPRSTRPLLGEIQGVGLNPERTAYKQVGSRRGFSDTPELAQFLGTQPELPHTTQRSGSTRAELRDLEDLQTRSDLQESPHPIRNSEEPHLPSGQERTISVQDLSDEHSQRLELLYPPEHSTQEEKTIINTPEVTATIPRETSADCGASEVGSAHVLLLESSLDQGPTGVEPQVLAPGQVHEPRESAGDSNQTTSVPLVEPPRAPYLLPNTTFRGHTENPPIEAFESWFANHRRRRAAKPTARATTSVNKSRAKRASTLPVSLSTTVNSNSGKYSRRSLSLSMKAMSNSLPATSPAVSVAALRERLALRREERSAKVAATRNARNTLSMLPHPAVSLQVVSRSPSIASTEQAVVSPAEPVSLPEVGAEVLREHSVLAVPQSFPLPNSPVSSDTVQNGMMLQTQVSTMSQTPFGPPHLGPAEWVIGLPLRTKSVTPNGIDQKKAYVNSIVGKHAEIQLFLSNPDSADPGLVRIMQDIVDTSGRIATHPDLPFDKVGISANAPGKEAEYHTAMSSKFVFLKAFLAAVKGLFLKIVIVAEEGKLIDILEIFLRGLKVCYTRLDRLSMLSRIPDDDLEGLVKVFLLPSCKSGAVTNAADCLIAMDSTFNPELPEIRGFRSNIVEVEKLAPVIRLVGINTVEHLRLCHAPGQDIPLQVYIETLKNLRLQVGIAASQEYRAAVIRAPARISEWLQKKAEGVLDIPNIPELPLFEPATQPTAADPTEGNDKRKRQVIVEDNFGTQTTDASVSQPIETKRLRVHDPVPDSSLPVFSQQQDDITHVSDSMPSQTIPTMTAEQPELPRRPGPEQELISSPMDLESEEKEGDEEEVREGKEEEKIELEDGGVTFVRPTIVPSGMSMEFMSREDLACALKKTVDELQQWMDSTGRLQVRHEELRRTLLEVKKSLRESQKTQEGLETRKERMLNELMKLKTERAQLWTDLEQARKSLLAGPPETAQLEQLRAENEKLGEKLRSAENSAQARERDFDFLRDQYQQASNGAFELRGDNDKLRKEISVLEKRSDEVVVQLRRLQLGNQVATRDKLIEVLSLQLKEREERIARLEHERAVSTRSRGSLGMRGSSVSIRGSPIQSRATSPTNGGGFHGRESLTHPLRNG